MKNLLIIISIGFASILVINSKVLAVDYDLASGSSYDIRFDGNAGDTISDDSYESGDINGDGYEDLVIGSPGTANGSVYVIFGPITEGIKGLDTSTNYNIRYDGAAFPNSIGGGFFHKSMEIADLNNDGVKDLVISGQKVAYVIYSTLIDDVGTSTGNVISLATSSNYNIRYSNATAGLNIWDIETGDMNGDSSDDLLLGYNSDEGYIIFSTLIDNISSTGNNLAVSTSTNFNVKFHNDSSGNINGFFAAETRIQDVNGDGLSDLVSAVPGGDFGGHSNNGVILIYYSTLLDDGGTSTGNSFDVNTDNYYSVAIYGETNGDEVGAFELYLDTGGISIGDINGDSNNDLVVGSPLYTLSDNGAAWVLFSTLLDNYSGSGNTLDLAVGASYNIRYTGVNTDDSLTWGGIEVSDINGDGLGDLSMGASGATFGGSDSGSVYVIFSTLLDNVGVSTGNNLGLGTSTNYNLRIDGDTGDQLGAFTYAILSGDVNGDFDKDLIIGSAYASNNGASSGSVWIIASTILDNYNSTTGNNTSLSNTSNYTDRYDGPAASTNIGEYNKVSFFDINSDGLDDLLIGDSDADNDGTDSGSLYVILVENNSGILGASMRIVLRDNVNAGATTDVEVWFSSVDVATSSRIILNYDILHTGGVALTTTDITLTCDTDGLDPLSGGNMASATVFSSENGYLEIDTGASSCTDYIVIDIHGGGGNSLTNPVNPGNYSWSVNVDNGNDGEIDGDGATLAYVQGENDVNITASVPPVLDLELYETGSNTLLNGTGANTCALGVLSINTVSTCNYDIGTGTNNQSGVSLTITSDGPLDDGAGNTIDSCSGTNCNGLGGAGVSAGEEEYGIYISELGGGEYTASNSFGTQHQAVPAVDTIFASTSSTGSGTTTGSISQRLEVTHAASISTGTNQGGYNQVVTFKAYTN